MPKNLGRNAAPIQGAIREKAAELREASGETTEQRLANARKFAAQKPAMQRYLSGPGGRTAASLGTVVDHLDVLRAAGEAWDAGDYPMFNRLSAIITTAVGKPAAGNFNAVARIVGPEIAKAIYGSGTGSMTERLALEQQFNTAQSPAQLAGVTENMNRLMAGQLDGQWRLAKAAGISREDFEDLIGEKAASHFKRYAPQSEQENTPKGTGSPAGNGKPSRPTTSADIAAGRAKLKAAGHTDAQIDEHMKKAGYTAEQIAASKPSYGGPVGD